MQNPTLFEDNVWCKIVRTSCSLRLPPSPAPLLPTKTLNFKFYNGHYASNIEPTHEQCLRDIWRLVPTVTRVTSRQGWSAQDSAGLSGLSVPPASLTCWCHWVVMSCDEVCWLHTSLHSWWLLWPLNGHYVVNKSLIQMFYGRNYTIKICLFAYYGTPYQYIYLI